MPRAAMVLGVAVAGVLGLAAVRSRADSTGDGPPVLHVERAVVTEGDTEAAAYLSIVNEGGTDRLLVADADGAGTVSIHRAEDRDGLVVMVPEPSIEVAANGTTELRPGDIHLMLEDLARPLEPGDELTLVLSFGRSGSIPVRASVVTYSEIARSFERP
jgi:copper(I)-binding protein